MATHGFSGKTMFISGASRGIGLAIAKRVAADGANIALVAKTTEPHPKLPGTIVLVTLFFICFVLYYFVNWKYLSELWLFN